MITVDLVVIGGILSICIAVLKAISSMKNDLKERIYHENKQNESISNLAHRVDLLEQKNELEQDKLELAINGLNERINHNRGKLDERINNIEAYLDKSSDYRIRGN